MIKHVDQIQLLSNVFIDVRERGKKRKDLCREGKNIWTYHGREWVTMVMSYATSGYPNPADNDRISYIGFGVGGDQQTILPIGAPIDTDYPGQNLFADSDPDRDYLERPARIWTSTPPNDEWLREITYASTQWAHIPGPAGTSRWVRYFASFTAAEFIATWGYSMVPLSEIGLFHHGYSAYEFDDITSVYDYGTPPAYVGPRPTPVAYHTFPSIPKTTDLELTVRWEVRVGG